MNWLHKLNPGHRPVYREKFLRVLRVILYILNKEISLMMKELYLLYSEGFVASTSDFWWHPVMKQSFGACIANFMANKYRFKNGLDLFMSDTTFQGLSEEVLRELKVKTPKLDRCQALCDFVLYDLDHTGNSIGHWLEDAHRNIGCYPSYIGSHVVDGAGNAGKSVEVLKWRTTDDRQQEIVTKKCDAHQANTSGKRASGTSSHVVNYNPACGMSLTKLHDNLTRVCRSGARMKVVENVQKENKRTNTTKLDRAVKTRWGSDHEECKRANLNQRDFKESLSRMVCNTGIDKDIYRANSNNLNNVLPSDREWRLYQQYESGCAALRQYSLFTQSAQVVVHMELFEAKVALERLSAKFFPMFENLSSVEGQRGHDLNKRLLNQLVTEEDYFPTQELSSGFLDSHVMMEEIQILRRVAFRELIVRLEIMEKDPDYDGNYDEVSPDINLPLTIGIRDVAELNVMKMMGALCNPLFQNKKRMVASGLCTDEQYESGKSELLKRMCHFIEGSSAGKTVLLPTQGGAHSGNEWSEGCISFHGRGEERMGEV